MAKTCSAVARSTGSGCQKRAVPGSRYCLVHVERGPLLLAGIVGAVLSLVVTEGFRLIVPSSESRQLAESRRETGELRTGVKRLESEATTLRQEVTRYQGQLQEERRESAERERHHAAELAKLNTKLDPFIRVAVDRYPGLDVDEALKRLRTQIEEVRVLASPPVLSYASHLVQPGPQGPILTVHFKRSKDAALGRLVFHVSVTSGAGARILQVGPSGTTMSIQTSVSADGKSGSVQYSSPSGDDPGIKVGLSAPARIQVEGNHGLQPFVLDVK